MRDVALCLLTGRDFCCGGCQLQSNPIRGSENKDRGAIMVLDGIDARLGIGAHVHGAQSGLDTPLFVNFRRDMCSGQRSKRHEDENRIKRTVCSGVSRIQGLASNLFPPLSQSTRTPYFRLCNYSVPSVPSFTRERAKRS